MGKVIDILPFTSGEEKVAHIHYKRHGFGVLVTIDNGAKVDYMLSQVAGENRVKDEVFVSFARSFGITPQLLQGVIVTEYLRIASQL